MFCVDFKIIAVFLVEIFLIEGPFQYRMKYLAIIIVVGKGKK